MDMKFKLGIYLAIFTLGSALTVALAQETLSTRSPFGMTVISASNNNGSNLLRVDFTVPQNCVLYFDRLHFRTSGGTEIHPVKIPDPILEIDKFSGKEKKVYEHDFSAELNLADLPDHQLAIKFQGCTNAACFFPEVRLFAPNATGTYAEVSAPENSTGSNSNVVAVTAGQVDWNKEFQGFTVKGQQTGYLNSSEFLSFLDHALSGQAATDPLGRFQHMGMLSMLLLILVGGLLLNFTPCILPMIPINLAIIGAGRQAKSRMEGFQNGAVYGIGMALAYGTLGLVVVLTGSKFGTLNSSMWFNLIIALVFVVLALGMFDVINIDLSRFSGSGPMGVATRGTLMQKAVILSMGAMSALLAGACVAPVVISVVLMATNFYSKGVTAGLLLPFLLGVGMALPWPIAGAGLTFMPKPGGWMKYVKYGFGVMIIGFAIYYAHLAWNAHKTSIPQTASAVAAKGEVNSGAAAAERDLLAAIQQARSSGRPLFVDFHASWCKDCSAMDETVFNRAEVKQRLQDFVSVRYAAEQPNEMPIKPLLDHFNIVGLPTYLVLTAK